MAVSTFARLESPQAEDVVERIGEAALKSLRVRAVVDLAERIRGFELIDPSGSPLPDHEPGAHVDVIVPGIGARQYSLCNEPGERDCYRIGVLEVVDGRGGSVAMHRNVSVGDTLDVSEPRNMFSLSGAAEHSILIAGGIGITPIVTMAESLEQSGAPYELHYCTESPSRTAFIDRLARNLRSGSIHIHHDNGDPKRRLAFGALVASPAPGTHLYHCGPIGLMRAIEQATLHWPRDTVHSESFATPFPVVREANMTGASTMTLFLKRSQRSIDIGADQTLLAALREAGISVESSCEAGLCGTCRVRYLSGIPEHNDLVLSEAERREHVLVCCARATDDSLVLDL